jgi:methylase of polypeptide subunit release factors
MAVVRRSAAHVSPLNSRLSPANVPDLGWLRDALRAADYTADRLKRVLGITYPDDVGLLNHAPALERLGGDATPAAVCTRLFFLEAAEPQRQVAAALSSRVCAALTRAGLVRRRGAQLQAQLRIDPVGDQYFVADRRFRKMSARAMRLPGSADPVYPPGSDSLILRDAVAMPPVRRLLDLCTGSGIQALQQAHLAQDVVAVDVSPRAAGLARINALLNGVTHVEVRTGDLYDAVRTESFDTIIANPPFVTSPYRTGPAYHAGGATGDAVLRRVIAGWTRHLRDGGRAFAISHVGLRAGEDIGAVAAQWLRSFPGRALVLVLETGSIVDLAAAQSLFALERGLAAYAAEVRRWVCYLRRRRVTAIAAVLIAAERGAAAALDVADAAPRVLPIPLGPPPAQRIRAWLGDAS